MARIRSRSTPVAPETRDELVAVVVSALRGEEQPNQPVIFEVPSGDSGFFEVIVVWDRWAGLTNDACNEIVREAYQQSGPQSPDGVTWDRISMLLPVTVELALEMNLLPYLVMWCDLKTQDSRPGESPPLVYWEGIDRRVPDTEHIRELIKLEGAIERNAGTELRLPTLQMAREARDRLQEKTRERIHWQIYEASRLVD